MKIGIMDCGGANLNSIKYSIDRLGLRSVISNKTSVLERSDKLIVPGVGAADIVMNQLKDKGLDILLKAYKGPILGICVGMQVLFEHSEEGETNCLGLLKGNVIKLKGSAECPIPHMGWNYAKSQFDSISDYYYYANSYAVINSEDQIASTEYVEKISAVVKKDNLYGCQFHPEKSSQAGSNFLKFFINA